MLFPPLEQHFYEVGKTKWKNVISARCPNKESKMNESFLECKQDYLKALAGFPNIINQLISWFCMMQKPALMPMHDHMCLQVQLFGYLKNSFL
jgi:hypothetical protein